MLKGQNSYICVRIERILT